MNNATPGPWALDDYTDDSLILIYGEHGDNVAEIYHVSTGARSLANARLIAAAPDMAAEIERLKAERAVLLEALSKAVADLEDSVIGKRALDRAWAAIAKASE